MTDEERGKIIALIMQRVRLACDRHNDRLAPHQKDQHKVLDQFGLLVKLAMMEDTCLQSLYDKVCG